MRVIVIAVSLLASLAFGAQRTQQRVLDLTQLWEVAKVEDAALLVEGSKEVSSRSSERTELPVSVTLKDIEPATFAQFAPLVFTVVIKNVGNKTILLPWSAASAELRQMPSQLTIRASILVVALLDKKRHVLAGTSVMGAESAGGTLMRLPPNETATMIVPATWFAAEDSRRALSAHAPGETEVFATVSIDEGTKISYAPIVSSNRVPLTVKQ